MSDLSFTTALDEHAAGHDATPEPPPQLTLFEIDGEPYAVVRPIDEAFLMILSAASRHSTLPEKIYGVFEFLDACTEQGVIADALDVDGGDRTPQVRALLVSSGERIRDRLMDRAEPGFNTEKLFEIMQRLVEQWTGKAGGPQTGSSNSRRTTGRKSTARSSSKASTSSRSSATRRRAG